MEITGSAHSSSTSPRYALDGNIFTVFIPYFFRFVGFFYIPLPHPFIQIKMESQNFVLLGVYIFWNPSSTIEFGDIEVRFLKLILYSLFDLCLSPGPSWICGQCVFYRPH